MHLDAARDSTNHHYAASIHWHLVSRRPPRIFHTIPFQQSMVEYEAHFSVSTPPDLNGIARKLQTSAVRSALRSRLGVSPCSSRLVVFAIRASWTHASCANVHSVDTAAKCAKSATASACPRFDHVLTRFARSRLARA